VTGPPHRELVDRLDAEILDVFASVVPRGSRCALLNFPNLANPGDAAIWLGQRAILSRLDVRIVYECEWRTYSARTLEAVLDGDTTILLNGGGNFGDLYPFGQQSVRERVLDEFRGTRIVQLPQSVHFDRKENAVRMKRLVEAHGSFTLLVREQQSLVYARSAFDVPVLPCPDAAFAVQLDSAPAPPDCDVVWITRTDKEERFTPPEPREGLVVADWGTEDAAGADILRQNRELLGRMVDEPKGATDWRDFAATFEPLARARVECAVSTLSRGRAIVTERLHGHILALLLGLPHIVLDNSYGKTRSVYETWTSASGIARLAGSAEEALALADEYSRLARRSSNAASSLSASFFQS
jgi:exopolysaccharide biosynthesis predicted pyruvyltransferase EpsI